MSSSCRSSFEIAVAHTSTSCPHTQTWTAHASRSLPHMRSWLSWFSRSATPRRPYLEPSLSTVFDARQLVSCVRPSILRGVRADIALRDCGNIFKSGGIGVSSICDDYSLSEPVELLDEFISHDWATGRLVKFLTLCIVFNLQAAMVTSLIFGVCLNFADVDSASCRTYRRVFAGQVCEVRLDVRCQIGCPIAFMLVLLYWQQIRHALGFAVHRLFIDKVCINQSHEDLKTEGILSLAGFLKQSRRLLILWRPRYFTRLWCTYEIASWLYHGKDFERSVELVPVDFAGILIQCTIMSWGGLLWLCFLRAYIFNRGDTFAGSVMLPVGLSACVFFFFLNFAVYRMVGIFHDLHGMPSQLARFSIRNSECFCCQHRHIHPDTQERLPCDRKLVYQTLKGWSSRISVSSKLEDCDHDQGGIREVACVASEVSDREVDTFDMIVRTKVAAQLGNRCADMGYSRALMPALPFLWFLCDQVRNINVIDAGWPMYFCVVLRESANEIIYFAAIMPCSMWVLCHSAVKLEAAIEMSNSRCRHVVLTLSVTVIVFLSATTVILCFEACSYLAYWQPQFLMSVCLLFVSYCLFHHRNLFGSARASPNG